MNNDSNNKITPRRIVTRRVTRPDGNGKMLTEEEHYMEPIYMDPNYGKMMEKITGGVNTDKESLAHYEPYKLESYRPDDYEIRKTNVGKRKMILIQARPEATDRSDKMGIYCDEQVFFNFVEFICSNEIYHMKIDVFTKGNHTNVTCFYGNIKEPLSKTFSFITFCLEKPIKKGAGHNLVDKHNFSNVRYCLYTLTRQLIDAKEPEYEEIYANHEDCDRKDYGSYPIWEYVIKEVRMGQTDMIVIHSVPEFVNSSEKDKMFLCCERKTFLKFISNAIRTIPPIELIKIRRDDEKTDVVVTLCRYNGTRDLNSEEFHMTAFRLEKSRSDSRNAKSDKRTTNMFNLAQCLRLLAKRLSDPGKPGIIHAKNVKLDYDADSYDFVVSVLPNTADKIISIRANDSLEEGGETAFSLSCYWKTFQQIIEGIQECSHIELHEKNQADSVYTVVTIYEAITGESTDYPVMGATLEGNEKMIAGRSLRRLFLMVNELLYQYRIANAPTSNGRYYQSSDVVDALQEWAKQVENGNPQFYGEQEHPL